MNYLIFGAGGVGGTIGFYLTKAGKNATLIARNEHLKKMRENGLALQRLWTNETETQPVHAMDADSYRETPDVIFVCVKGYSLADTIPFIRRVAGKHTVVIPLLNLYGTGEKLQKELPDLLVLDGCVYVSANIQTPGFLIQHGPILRAVFGVREGQKQTDALTRILSDLKESGIDGILSENIRRDALEKFSYVSPIGAAGLYFHATAEAFQKEGEPRNMLIAMMGEIAALAARMGIPFEQDITERNLRILSGLTPQTTTSMQRDIAAGRPSEIGGLVYQVVRMGQQYGVPTPNYEKVIRKLEQEGL